MIAYFSCASGGYGATAYKVVDGSTISEEYNETLDSANILLAPITTPLSDIKPYDEVLLVQGTHEWHFLVDSFEETQMNNRAEGKIYSYTISLMSRTKYLEKIQLPNICVTHRADGRDTLYEVIQRLYNYVPKIKMITGVADTWYYQRFLALDTDGSFAGYGISMADKFSAPCADLQLSQPTLRQALTAVMTQVGCIPIVKGHRITWLDLRAEQEESGFDDTEIIVSRSQSSDSYVNTLVNSSGGLLDRTGKSVSERLCFRDRDNLLLKQLENLKLETRFPIYSVEKLIAYAYFSTQKLHLGPCDIWRMPMAVNRGAITLLLCTADDTEFTIEATESPIYPASFTGKAYYLKQISNSVAGIVWVKDDEFDMSFSGNTNPSISKAFPSSWQSGINNGSHFVVVLGTLTISGISGITTMQVFTAYSSASCDAQFTNSYYTNTQGAYTFSYIEYNHDVFAPRYLDVTKLCKESSARSGLSVDYTALTAIASGDVDTFSEYYYSTFEYSIGGNEITGFSQNYTEVEQGIWSNTDSVIENICKRITGWVSAYISLTDTQANDIFANIFDEYFPDDTYTYMNNPPSVLNDFDTPIVIYEKTAGAIYNNLTPINPYNGETEGSYATMFFDITYQPIASPVLRFTRKGSGGLPIEQLDSKQDGLSSVERVSDSEYDTIARLGSDVVCIHARIEGESDLVDLDTTYGDYTIFKRTISYRANFLEVDYYASKNYVIKNYFTSIITKYRAYQYVDFNQSVTRLECIHSFLEIRDNLALPVGSNMNIDEDDSRVNNLYRPKDYLFADGFWYKASKDGLCKSVRKYVGDLSNVYLDEVSICHSDRFFSITALDFDNASKGIYVDGTYISGSNQSSTRDLGGIPQRFYPAQTNLHEFGFCSRIPFFDVEATLNDVQLLPQYNVVRNSFDPKWYITLNVSNFAYKDGTERLGETWNVEVVNYVNGFNCNENLWANSTILGRNNNKIIGVLILPNLSKLKGQGELRSITYQSGDYLYEDMNGVLLSVEDNGYEMDDAVEDGVFVLADSSIGLIEFDFAKFFAKPAEVGTISRRATVCYLEYIDGKFYLEDVCSFEQNDNHLYKLMFRFNDTNGIDVYRISRQLLISDKKAFLATSSTALADWARKAIAK